MTTRQRVQREFLEAKAGISRGHHGSLSHGKPGLFVRSAGNDSDHSNDNDGEDGSHNLSARRADLITQDAIATARQLVQKVAVTRAAAAAAEADVEGSDDGVEARDDSDDGADLVYGTGVDSLDRLKKLNATGSLNSQKRKSAQARKKRKKTLRTASSVSA